ncbi:MAG: type II secretion system inner membrane protein GspF [Deltaproteobacteria bacterium]|nr:type II secretion system inner membrane protein GspF [Deltaproteobacteria bacterium]
MPVYEYKGVDARGREVSGIVDAENPRTARVRLRKQGVFPTEVEEQEAHPERSGKRTGKGLAMKVDLSRVVQRISASDVANATAQLATLVGAAIPMVEALTALLEQVEKPPLKVVLADVKERVNEGSSLAGALRAHPKVFDDLYVNMVAAGEQSGALDLVLKRLADHTEAMQNLKGKLISALIYPAIMALIGTGLLAGIFIVVVPRVRRLFDSFGETLPLLTRAFLGTSEVVADGWWLFVVLGAAAVFLFRRWVKKPEGRMQYHRMLLRLPLFGKIFRTIAVSRFSRTLATLLQSGVPIVTSLEIVRRVVGNDVLAHAIDEAARNITEGHSIAAPLRASKEFPALVTHMIAIGERTGDLEPMLEKVADSYDRTVERSLQAFASLLEPMLIVVMGGVLGTTAIALLLPMLQMSNLAGR